MSCRICYVESIPSPHPTLAKFESEIGNGFEDSHSTICTYVHDKSIPGTESMRTESTHITDPSRE